MHSSAVLPLGYTWRQSYTHTTEGIPHKRRPLFDKAPISIASCPPPHGGHPCKAKEV